MDLLANMFKYKCKHREASETRGMDTVHDYDCMSSLHFCEFFGTELPAAPPTPKGSLQWKDPHV